MAKISTTETTYTRTDWKFRWRGLMGGLILAPLAVLALLSPPRITPGTWPDWLLNVLGFLCFLAGATWRFWSTLYIGGRKERFLVNDGPYSVCRNPLYVGTFLLALSFGLFLQSLIFGVGLVALLIFYLSATIPTEERFLSERLGEPYAEYRRTVPRFLPRFSLYHSPRSIEVVIEGLVREGKRALHGWMWLPVLGIALARLRGQGWWPVQFNFY